MSNAERDAHMDNNTHTHYNAHKHVTHTYTRTCRTHSSRDTHAWLTIFEFCADRLLPLPSTYLTLFLLAAIFLPSPPRLSPALHRYPSSAKAYPKRTLDSF